MKKELWVAAGVAAMLCNLSSAANAALIDVTSSGSVTSGSFSGQDFTADLTVDTSKGTYIGEYGGLRFGYPISYDATDTSLPNEAVTSGSLRIGGYTFNFDGVGNSDVEFNALYYGDQGGFALNTASASASLSIETFIPSFSYGDDPILRPTAYNLGSINPPLPYGLGAGKLLLGRDSGELQIDTFAYDPVTETPGPASISYEYPNSSMSAAPEPSTWALILSGLGGIGLMLRRVRKGINLRHRDGATA